MSDGKKIWPWGRAPDPDPSAPSGQRRASRVVHDERGNARIEWIDDSGGKLLEDRIPLEIVEDEADVRAAPVWNPGKVEKGWNPYQSVATPQRTGQREPAPGTRKDLRKLSEWIKLKREIEARKLRGEEDED